MTVKPTVIVVIARLGTGAGGEASLLDYAKVLASLKFRVEILIGKSTYLQRRKLRAFFRRSRRERNQVRVTTAARVFDLVVASSVNSRDFCAPPRHRFTAARFLLDLRRVRARNAVSKANFLLTSQAFSELGIQQLRNINPSLGIILNHNGSPEDFQNKWKPTSSNGHPRKMVRYESYLNNFERVIFQSNAHEKEFVAMHPTFRHKTVTVWASSDEKSCLEAQLAPSPFDGAHFEMLCVGKFQASKGQKELISAFSEISQEFPKVRLTFVGGRSHDISYFDDCVHLAMSSGASAQIQFLGQQSNPYKFIAHCDLFVFPSSAEGVSRAIREAAFLRKPIVCQRLSGLRSFLGESGAEYLTGGTVNEIREGLARALSKPTKLKDSGLAAHMRYRELARWQKFRDEAASVFSFPENLKSHTQIGERDNVTPPVILVLPNLAQGGAQFQAALLARQLRDKGHSVKIFLTHSKESTESNTSILSGIPIHFARDLRVDSRLLSLASFVAHFLISRRGLAAIAPPLKALTCRVLHKSAGISREISVLLQTNLKIAIAVRSLRWHLQHNSTSGIVSFLPQSNIVSLLSYDPDLKLAVMERNDFNQQVLSSGVREARIRLYPRATAIAANSRNAARQIASIFEMEDVRFFPNNLSAVENFEIAPRNAKNIVVVGRLEKQKRPLEVLEVFNWSGLAKRGWKLTFVGTGTLETELVQSIKESPDPSQLQFRGYVDNPRVGFLDSTICVINSDYEGAPNVLSEAVAFGLVPLVRGSVKEATEYIPKTLTKSLTYEDARGLGNILRNIDELYNKRDDIVASLQSHYELRRSEYERIRSDFFAELFSLEL